MGCGLNQCFVPPQQIEDLRVETEVDCIDWQTIRRGRKQRHIARPHGTGS